MNYNEYVKKLFGKRHALDSYLTYSIQFVELAAEQVAGPCRAAQIPERLRSYISAFDGGLSHDEHNSPKFSYRLLFKRKLVNKPGQAASVVEFIDPNSDLARRSIGSTGPRRRSNARRTYRHAWSKRSARLALHSSVFDANMSTCGE